MSMTENEFASNNFARADLVELLAACRSAQDLGRDWLLAHIDASGEPTGSKTPQCARLPWGLAVMGERSAAASVLGWLERNALTSTGDLREGEAREGFVSNACTYGLALIALGAASLERDDLSRKIMGTIAPWQDPVTGGVYSERPEARESGRQDLHDTAQLGFTALATGRIEIARAAFRWIRDLYALQPDLPRRLFTRTTADGLYTEPTEALEWTSIIDFTQPRQAFFNPGLAAAFLARYALATADPAAIELALRFLDLSANGTQAQFDYTDSKQICKFGWGASLLDIADPASEQLSHVVRMARWFVDSQLADGRWQNSAFLNPNPTDGDDQEITVEFVLHLAVIQVAVATRLARGSSA